MVAMVPGQQEPAAPEYKQYINLEPLIGDASSTKIGGGVFSGQKKMGWAFSHY